MVLRPPLLPVYGSLFLLLYAALAAFVIYTSLRRPNSFTNLLFDAAWLLVPLVARLTSFRLELGPDGMRWRFGFASYQADWNEIEFIELDPHSEEASIYGKHAEGALPLPLQQLSFEDARTAVHVWNEHDLLVESGGSAPARPTTTTHALPWTRLGIHPGMLLAYVLLISIAFGAILLGAILGLLKLVVVAVVVAAIVLPRFWFRALRVDAEGIHVRRWPLPAWRTFAWRDVASIHGGVEARPLRLRDHAGAWHKTGVVVDRGDFFALRAALHDRTAEAVFA
ncbi:MAG: hypothetical protein AB7T63_13975 [Planctomycetota bacterium]